MWHIMRKKDGSFKCMLIIGWLCKMDLQKIDYKEKLDQALFRKAHVYSIFQFSRSLNDISFVGITLSHGET